MNLTLDFSESNGLVQCDRPDQALNNYERLYLSELSQLAILPFAVFFRRYFKNDEGTIPYKSEPSVCIFEEQKVSINGREHKKVHAALWSEGKIDIYIIQGITRLEIFNARKPALRTGDGGTTLDSDTLRLAASALDEVDTNRFSARLFGTGTFWEQKENQHYISVDQTPYKHLLDYLMEVRKSFYQRNTQFDGGTIDKLLVLSIMVKFLEEKKDTHTQRSTLDEIYEKYSIRSLEQAVSQGRLLDVLDDLALEFNGKLFDQFSNSEKALIQNANLSLLANFLSANIDVRSGQGFLWEQYSFAHLPAEVISGIYENFIQAEADRDGSGREKGVVYTPVHLVNFLVDEAMPLNVIPQSFQNSGTYKVLDPSCGSGVFLVAAYKRLLQWQAILDSERTGTIAYPDKARAQKILEENIFGVEVKETAVLVTIFGLTTALLDYLTPKEVWNNLKFKDLREHNIIREAHPSGFFKWALKAKRNELTFSLAIGNPPFNPEKGKSKNEVLDLEILNELDIKHKIPGNKFELYFLEGSMQLVDKVCMIIRSSSLLYDKSKIADRYRQELLKDCTISDIYDFTHLRETLFVKKGEAKKTGRTPVLALIADNYPSKKRAIVHTVVKRTISVEQKIKFEIDEYDRHSVPWSWAIDTDKQFVWKTNLLGGGRLFHLVYRLSLLQTLGDFVKKRKDWIYKSGYKVGGKATKKVFAHFMSEGDEIDEISENGDYTIHRDKEKINQVEYFPNPKIYTPPVIVFDQVIGNNNIPATLITSYPKKYIYFNRDLVGIHAPSEDVHDLSEVYQSIAKRFNNLYRLYALCHSGSSLIQTETEINKRDIDIFPYPSDLSKLNLSYSEKIIQKDVLKYNIHFGKAITKDGAVLHQSAKNEEIIKYGETLCTELNDIYAQQGSAWQIGKIYRMAAYTICQIGFGNNGKLIHKLEEGHIDETIRLLINNEKTNRGATYKRLVRLYQHVDGFDCVYFIKPNAYRYWLQSIALRDADETFADFQTKGY